MGDFECVLCNKSFVTLKGLRGHKKAEHEFPSNPFSDYAINLFMSELSNSSPECKAKLKRMLKDLLEPV